MTIAKLDGVIFNFIINTSGALKVR
ncbi:hypothetical protein PPBDW_II1150 [Photobacterium kishitanii]|nr:hypothetical protein PPBDW_II1150 [Photobacterium kishitanii]